MAINWFEGGRRITWLLMAIPAMIGGYNAYDHSPSRVVFFTASPRDGWHFDEYPYAASNLDSCAEIKNFSDFQIKEGLVRDIALCFKPNAQGQIVYFSPKEETERLKRETERLKRIAVANARARIAGDIEAVRILSEEASRVREILAETGTNELSGGEYDQEVVSYVDRRVADFAINPEILSAIEKSLPPNEKEELLGHLKTTLSLTAYWIGGIWIFSFVLGWIVRGFAGVPRGQDFKTAGSDPKNSF
jgi:hypothetical protein